MTRREPPPSDPEQGVWRGRRVARRVVSPDGLTVLVGMSAEGPRCSPVTCTRRSGTPPSSDEGAFPVFGNNWFVLEYLKNKEVENTAAFCAWLLRVTKGYAIKVVNPGGTEAWAWGLNCLSVNDPVPYFDITPAEIITGLIEANEYLGLPIPCTSTPTISGTRDVTRPRSIR